MLSNAIDAMGFIMSLFNVHTFVSWWLIIRLSQCMYVFLWLCDESSYLFYRVQKRQGRFVVLCAHVSQEVYVHMSV